MQQNLVPFSSLQECFDSPQTAMVLMHVCGHRNSCDSNDCITRTSLLTNNPELCFLYQHFLSIHSFGEQEKTIERYIFFGTSANYFF